MKKTSTLTLLTLGTSLIAVGASKSKPNVIFFLMDDMGYAELGVMGQTKIETPNIDALARSGKILTDHYSGSPVSAPSRCVLLTGQHTGHSQIRGNDEDGSRGAVWSHQAMFDNPALEGQKPMRGDTRTMAKAFQESGYTTACIGKWGLGFPGSVSEPNKMGFDFFYGYNCQRMSHTYYPPFLWKNDKREYLDNKVLQPGTKLKEGLDPLDRQSYAAYEQKTYAPDRMFQETIGFIEANKDKPFFMWWTTPMPHVSLQAPKDLVDYYVEKFGDEQPFLGDSYFPCRYPRATYAAMVTYIDRNIGQIVDKLKAEGLYDNTIIVFTSDNGPTFNGGTDSPWFDSAHPFMSDRGWGKCSVMEGGIRVPTFVSWPGKIEAGTKSSVVGAFQDWWPTLMALTGNKMTETDLDGISLAPTLIGKGKQASRAYLYWEYPEAGCMVALRQGDWKMVVKNVRKAPVFALYNLANDPIEQNNLVQSNPEKLAELKALAASSHTEPENPLFKMGLPLK